MRCINFVACKLYLLTKRIIKCWIRYNFKLNMIYSTTNRLIPNLDLFLINPIRSYGPMIEIYEWRFLRITMNFWIVFTNNIFFISEHKNNHNYLDLFLAGLHFIEVTVSAESLRCFFIFPKKKYIFFVYIYIIICMPFKMISKSIFHTFCW